MRMTAFRELVDTLLIARQDVVLDEALRAAPSPRLMQLLQKTIEYAIEQVSTVAFGAAIQSHLFCAATIVRFIEPVTSTEFDDLLRCTPIEKYLRFPELDGSTPGSKVLVLPAIFTFQELAARSFSAHRQTAAQLLERFTHPDHKPVFPPAQPDRNHHRSRIFLRYVVGSRIIVGAHLNADESCRILSNALSRSLTHISEAVESARCVCDGTFFAAMHAGRWSYQVARLEGITHHIAYERQTMDALAATISAHQVQQALEARIGFFHHEKLIAPHAYSLAPIPCSSAEQCVRQISQAIVRSGIATVYEFPKVQRETAKSADGRTTLPNPRGQMIASQTLLPL
jgi:hypothetical protein